MHDPDPNWAKILDPDLVVTPCVVALLLAKLLFSPLDVSLSLNSRTGSLCSSNSSSSDRQTAGGEAVRQVWTLEGRQEDVKEDELVVVAPFLEVAQARTEQLSRPEPSLEDVLSEGW